jgi:hypothetical protein
VVSLRTSRAAKSGASLEEYAGDGLKSVPPCTFSNQKNSDFTINGETNGGSPAKFRFDQ